MTGIRQLTTILFATLLLAPAWALAADEIRFSSIAEIEAPQINAKGEKILVRQPAGLVVPGTLVIYTNSFTNIGDKPAERLTVTNPIPENMEYLGGSATTKDAIVIFSIDGGKSFDPPEKLFVVEKDGNRRLAEAKEYTHIRWILNKPLPSNGKGAVEFRARLK